MNDQAQQQLAAIRERLALYGPGFDPVFRRAEIECLLTLLADAERERDELDRDSEILLGVEWRRSVQAANGDPEAAREHRIAALVADLEEANERAEQAADARQAEIVAWLKQCADDQEDRGDDIAIRMAAVSIERGEFRAKGASNAKPE